MVLHDLEEFEVAGLLGIVLGGFSTLDRSR